MALRSAIPAFALVLALCLSPRPTLGQTDAPSQAPASPTLEASLTAAAGPIALAPDGRLPLEGTTWRLRAYRRGHLRPPGPEVAAWLSLRAGRVSGSGGCTSLRGGYARMGDAIVVRLRPGARPECAEQTVIVQRAMRAALQVAASAEVVGEDAAELVIRDRDGVEQLRFEPDDVASLDGAEWRLASYARAGEVVVADPAQVAVLAFHPETTSQAERRSSGEVIGSSGCNGLVGTYARSGDVVDFGELETSGAPCTEALAAQEAAVLAVLESQALLLDLPADRLTLTATDSGDRLEYVASVPLEGTTWQLERAPGAPQPVTLRLVDGVVSGEGPCGAYRGAYASDGRFITFRGLSAAGGESCPQRKAGRAFLARLASSTLIERARPGLRLLDARGRVLARFSPAASGP